VLNLFYEEPDEDRWLPFDRVPRRIVRRVLRGESEIGGHQRVSLNLRAGLERLGVPYRFNDYDYARRNPNELACIIGKAQVLDKIEWKNPILFGTAVFSHPSDDPHLFERRPVKKILVPGVWMKALWKPFWDETIAVWPVGIDTDRWRPASAAQKRIDVLLYDKVMWDRERAEARLIEPIRESLRQAGRSFREIRYGAYRETEFAAALAECRTMIFLCEHETQGIAYQQALAAGVPILAWDRGGYWLDPAYFPAKAKFQPVTSVPYWDERCGRTFAAIEAFDDALRQFWDEFQSGRYDPRAYIIENLTLEKCAQNYVHQAQSVSDD
jgi:hypothetical protein